MIAATRLKLAGVEDGIQIVESGDRIPAYVPTHVQQYLAANGWAVEEEIPGD